MSHEVFKKDLVEKIKLLQMKRDNILNRKNQYGKNYKKYLNNDKDYLSALNP